MTKDLGKEVAYLSNLRRDAQFLELLDAPMERLLASNLSDLKDKDRSVEEIRFAQGVVYAVEYFKNLIKAKEALYQKQLEEQVNARRSG